MITFVQEEDPFWEDPCSFIHVGSSHIYLQSLAYMMEIDENLQITDHRGIEKGIFVIESNQIFAIQYEFIDFYQNTKITLKYP